MDFRRKPDAKGNIDKFITRPVAKGYLIVWQHERRRESVSNFELIVWWKM